MYSQRAVWTFGTYFDLPSSRMKP
uniref:Sxd1 n=1 Tax=Arundo donax TaxID=35708 RepID=A0A0A9FUD0_ARUDO